MTSWGSGASSCTDLIASPAEQSSIRGDLDPVSVEVDCAVLREVRQNSVVAVAVVGCRHWFLLLLSCHSHCRGSPSAKPPVVLALDRLVQLAGVVPVLFRDCGSGGYGAALLHDLDHELMGGILAHARDLDQV